ncbi:YhgE/Pip-like protein [Tumebacillus sp. BK434]|uniref:YhgE/Pip domain-containing protein n=1 Tax=Tumebacillus sp. BK434 TaxID=2512169 RepID=UPI0010443781|nr:ABC transporter permease [Tumebacillus sp. BK434]TCP52522.1 YhgE/Pip-like protein [Tumebacillus sp. BK434]
MKSFAHVFTQKFFYIGLAVVLLVGTIMVFANMGSTVSPTPTDLPVALVVEDEGQFGQMMAEKIQGVETPLKWTLLDSEQAALDALDREEYYAAVVLPQALSGQLATLQTPAPKQAEVKVYINQGKSLTAANLANGVIEKMFTGVNAQLREQTLAAVKQRGNMLSTELAAVLAAPVKLTSTPLHPVGSHSANGNAPAVLTQLVWFCSMIGAVLMFLAASKNAEGKSRFAVLLGQMLAGIFVIVVGVLTVLGLATGILGLELSDFWQVALFLMFAGYCFFLLQTTLLSWIGLGGMPILVLMFFFGAPVLSLPKEMLPVISQDWLYSWLPLRFSVDGLRDILYFGNGDNLADPMWTLGWIGAAGVVLILASSIKNGLANKRADLVSSK